MKVSIIIPVYNVEKYIDECILSAINQTLDNIEIIAIDDKSTDSSLDILNKYREKYNFIKIISNEKNVGISANRNIGIRSAKGEYIYFLDSDDYIDENAMEICYKKAKEYDLDIVTFDAEIFRDKEYKGNNFNENYDRDKIIDPECIKGEDFFYKYSTTGGYKQSVMINFYKRDFIIQNNLFFYEGIIGEDELHSFKAFLSAQRVLYIPKKLFFRRVRDNSIMTSVNYKKRLESTEVVIREMCVFYLNNKDSFKLDTLESMKNYIKFIFDIAIIFCDRGNLINDKNRIIETFKIDDEIILKEPVIKTDNSDEESNNKKNIVFVMYVLLDGGAEKALMTILDNLDYSKYNVDLIVLAKEKSHLYNINKNVNVSYIYDTMGQLYDEYTNGNFNLEFKKEYDIEIGFLGIFTTWVICRFGNPNAKKITWLHGDFSLMICGNSIEYVTDIYGRMDNIISVSDGVSKSFTNFIGDCLNTKLQRIYVPVDISQIRKLSLEEFEYKKNKFTIMSIGRLSSEKGFERLIRVHKRLIDEGIDNELIILGSGGEEENLRRLVKDLGLENSCKLIEYQKNPYPWVKMCDVFVSSSHAEALGLAIIDAMVLEKPIVATDTHGSRALFKDKLGLMVSNSEDGLYYGLRLMILNQDVRNLFIKNLKEVEKFDFDKSIVMPEIERLFDGGKK